MTDLIDDLPLDDDEELALEPEPEAELTLGDEWEESDLPLLDGEPAELPIEDAPQRGLSPVDERRVAEALRDLDAVAPLVEILPAGFPLPTLIKFVPNKELKHTLDLSVAYGLGIDVKGHDKLALADTALGTIRDAMKAITEHFAEPASIADQLHKGITSTRASWLREAESAAKTIGTRVATETKHLEEEAAAERRKEQAAADAKAREEASERARAAEAAQAPPEVVQSLKEQVETTRAEPVQQAAGSLLAPPKLTHSTVVTTWKSRFAGTVGNGDEEPHPEQENWTDLHRKAMLQLLHAIVDGKAPIKCVEPNWTYLDQRAVSDQKLLAIPGVEAFSTSGTRAKGRRR